MYFVHKIRIILAPCFTSQSLNTRLKKCTEDRDHVATFTVPIRWIKRPLQTKLVCCSDRPLAWIQLRTKYEGGIAVHDDVVKII